jgi:hypothetical protein
MTSHEHHGNPFAAAVALGAALLGAAGHWLEQRHPGLVAAVSPDEITAYTKAVCGAVFTAINTIVGCYHLLVFGHATIKRRRKAAAKARRNTPPQRGD